MKDPSHLIRKEVYDALNGNITLDGSALPVYNVVPDNGSIPYIYIYSVSNENTEDNKSNYISNSLCFFSTSRCHLPTELELS